MGFCDLFTVTWTQWWKKTSISGISNAANAKSTTRKLCWLTIFIILMVFTIFAVVGVFEIYLEYPVSTSMSLERHSKIKYPAITICNQNRVSCGKLNELVENCQTKKNCPLKADPTLAKMEKLLELVCTRTAAAKRRKRAAGKKRAPSSDELGAVPTRVDSENSFLKRYMEIDEEERQLIGHGFQEMIQSCTFRERDCLNSSWFKVSNTPNFGNCFTFNSAINDEDPLGGSRVASMTGPNFGLDLIININQDNYMFGGQTRQAGARLVVHESDSRPLPAENGIDLHPNSLTRIPVQQIRIDRLPDPYTSNCSADWTKTNYSYFLPENETGWNYTLAVRFYLDVLC